MAGGSHTGFKLHWRRCRCLAVIAAAHLSGRGGRGAVAALVAQAALLCELPPGDADGRRGADCGAALQAGAAAAAQRAALHGRLARTASERRHGSAVRLLGAVDKGGLGQSLSTLRPGSYANGSRTSPVAPAATVARHSCRCHARSAENCSPSRSGVKPGEVRSWDHTG